MPRIENAGGELYGSQQLKEGAMSVRARLEELFRPDDFVRITNPDNEQHQWQYLPPASEVITAPNERQRQRVIGQAETWILNPGETEVLNGYNAYFMIETLYKKMLRKEHLKKLANQDPNSSLVNSVDFYEPGQQKALINRIFLGVEQPSFNQATHKEAEAVKKS